MTREEAIEIIKQRVTIDRQNITNGGEPESDFDKFIAEQDEAMNIAIEIMKNSVGHMDENKHGFKPKQEFTMGGIAWTIIQTGKDWVKCITSDCVEKRAFDTENKNDFAVSSLRAYLNGEFLNRLIQAGTPEEMFEYFNIDLTADDGLNDYGGDRVRIGLITCDEYRLFRSNIPALPGRLWWTATADSPVNFLVRYVYLDGSLGGCQACDVGEGIRPICVLKSELLESYLGTRAVGQSAFEPETCNVKMDAKRFLEKLKRMCKSYGNNCKDCPARDSDGGCIPEEAPCYWDVDNILEMVEQWTEEHPRKTRLDDFLKKYPNAQVNGQGLPYMVPRILGYCQANRCGNCPHVKDWGIKDCWDAEVEKDETD